MNGRAAQLERHQLLAIIWHILQEFHHCGIRIILRYLSLMVIHRILEEVLYHLH